MQYVILDHPAGGSGIRDYCHTILYTCKDFCVLVFVSACVPVHAMVVRKLSYNALLIVGSLSNSVGTNSIAKC